jgi:hypothetical protein
MNSDPGPAPPGADWLERLTAAVLLGVVGVLGWVVLRAYQPELVPLGSEAVEVLLLLALLTAALGLVSLVALLHTRPRRDPPAP